MVACSNKKQQILRTCGVILESCIKIHISRTLQIVLQVLKGFGEFRRVSASFGEFLRVSESSGEFRRVSESFGEFRRVSESFGE